MRSLVQTVFGETCERVFSRGERCCCIALLRSSVMFCAARNFISFPQCETLARWRHLVQLLPHSVCFSTTKQFSNVFPFSLCLSHSRENCCIRSSYDAYGILFLIWMPLYTDCSSKCLTSPKGLPLVLCRVQGIAITANGRLVLSEPTQRGRRQRILQTHHTNKWPSRSSTANGRKRRESRRSLPLAVQRMWYFGPCSTPSLPYALIKAWSVSFFLQILDMNGRETTPLTPQSDWSASFAWSLKQGPHRHQHFVYPPTLTLWFVSPGSTSTHKLTQFWGWTEGRGVSESM